MDTHHHLFTECTTPKINPTVHYGLWVMVACLCRSSVITNVLLVGDADNGGHCLCVGAGDLWAIPYRPLNFVVNL